jgi:hypothetical protein
MKPGVQQMAIADVVAGMVLAEALCDHGGGVLLPAGATLTDATLSALRRRGIDSLGVLGDQAVDDHAVDDQAERARRCARLAHIFRNSAEVDATGALLERLQRYRREH